MFFRTIRRLFFAWLALMGLVQARAEPPPLTDALGDPLPPGAIARLGTLRLRHGGPVRAIAYSPDGKLLASASDDRSERLLEIDNRTLRIWDATNGKPLRSLTGHRGHVYSVVFAPDGSMLASAGQDGTVRLWNVSDWKPLGVWKEHKGEVHAVAFAPDGKTVASAGSDRSVRLRDVRAGKQLHCLENLAHAASYVAFPREGNMLAFACDNLTHLVDSHTGKLIRSFRGHTESVRALAWTPDSKRLASAADSTMRVWDTGTGKELYCLKYGTERVESVAFSPDGKILALGQGSIHLWDTASGKPIRELPSNEICCLAFSPDGRTLASGGQRRTIQLWDVASGQPRPDLPDNLGFIDSLAFAPDGRTLATAGEEKVVRLWSLRDSRVIGRFPGELAMYSRDGRSLIAVAGIHSALTQWNLASQKPVRSWPGNQNGIQCIAVFPDGRTIASGGDGTVRLWDAANGKEVRTIHHPGCIDAIAISSDGTRLAASGLEETVRVWNVADGKLIRAVPGHRARVRGLVFAADGTRLISGGEDGTIRLWDVESGKESWRLTQGGHPVSSLALSPDGRLLAAACGERALRLWEVDSGEEVHLWTGHEQAPRVVAFSPDGARLASGSNDTTILVWSIVELTKGSNKDVADLDQLWSDLAGNAAMGQRAVSWLASGPNRAIPLLAKRLSPIMEEDVNRIRLWLAELDHDDFDRREAASAALGKCGDRSEPLLQGSLADTTSAEARRRVEQLLDRRNANGVFPQRLRTQRAIQTLEQIGTSPARKMLEALGAGLPEFWLTREAKAALKRLACRPAPDQR